MTLPTISPVILFAVVIAVIEALAYFTEAYVASTIAAPGAAGQAGDVTNELGYPQDSTLFYPVLLYQQGFRYFNMGYASAMAVLLLFVALAVTLVILRRSRRWVHYAGGAQVDGGGHPARAGRAAAPPAARAARRPPRAVRRKRLLITIADHSILIALAIMFLAPFVFIVLTSLMTDDQALSTNLWPDPLHLQELLGGLRRGTDPHLRAELVHLRRAGDPRRHRLERPRRLRARAPALARAQRRRSSSSSRR